MRLDFNTVTLIDGGIRLYFPYHSSFVHVSASFSDLDVSGYPFTFNYYMYAGHPVGDEIEAEEEMIVQELLPEAEPLETVEVMEVAEDAPRLFLTTPFDEYTVSEGLLLMLLLLAFVSICLKSIKEGFYWLW